MQWSFSPVLRRRLGYGLLAALLFGSGAGSLRLWDGARHVHADHVRHHDVVDTLGPGTLAQIVVAINALLAASPEAAAALQQQAGAPEPVPVAEDVAAEDADDEELPSDDDAR